MSRAILASLAAFVVLLFAPRARADDPAAAAIARAEERGLADGLAWQRLVLYRRHFLRWDSDVDGADFFLAKDGKKDPVAELAATIRAFYAPATAEPDKHALCNFPARRKMLERTIGLPGLPEPPCPKLAKYVAEMDVDAVSFVFAANYADNPASAFGHTLLHLRKRGATSEAEDHGVDYTARTNTKNPFLYAIKGMAGLFPGLFRFMPYPQMLLEYGGHESRDLWEYDLTLAPAEVEILVLHLWEISGPRIDYLYFSENCSYEIIAAIDAAAPRLRLLDDLNVVVLPIDTMKVVANRSELVARVRYRPSVRSLYHASTSQLDGYEQNLAELLVEQPNVRILGVDRERAALVLDTARLALETRFGPALGTSAYAATRERLIARRDALGATTVPLQLKPERSREPAQTHGSMRLVLGTGITSQYANGFATLGYRFNLHDFADIPNGNPELLQLQFMDVRLRFDYARTKLTVDSLTFAELMNIHPLGRYEKLLSWRVRGFGTRLHDRAAEDTFMHGLEAGVGAAIGTHSERLVFYALADASVGFGTGNIDGIGGSFVRVGLGPTGGVRWHVLDETVGVVTASWAWLPGSNLPSTFDVRGSLRFGLGRNVALGVEAAEQPRSREIQLASYLYF